MVGDQGPSLGSFEVTALCLQTPNTLSACHSAVKHWLWEMVAINFPSSFDFQVVFILMQSTTYPQPDGVHNSPSTPGLLVYPTRHPCSLSDTSIRNGGEGVINIPRANA